MKLFFRQKNCNDSKDEYPQEHSRIYDFLSSSGSIEDITASPVHNRKASVSATTGMITAAEKAMLDLSCSSSDAQSFADDCDNIFLKESDRTFPVNKKPDDDDRTKQENLSLHTTSNGQSKNLAFQTKCDGQSENAELFLRQPSMFLLEDWAKGRTSLSLSSSAKNSHTHYRHTKTSMCHNGTEALDQTGKDICSTMDAISHAKSAHFATTLRDQTKDFRISSGHSKSSEARHSADLHRSHHSKARVVKSVAKSKCRSEHNKLNGSLSPPPRHFPMNMEAKKEKNKEEIQVVENCVDSPSSSHSLKSYGRQPTKQIKRDNENASGRKVLDYEDSKHTGDSRFFSHSLNPATWHNLTKHKKLTKEHASGLEVVENCERGNTSSDAPCHSLRSAAGHSPTKPPKSNEGHASELEVGENCEEGNILIDSPSCSRSLRSATGQSTEKHTKRDKQHASGHLKLKRKQQKDHLHHHQHKYHHHHHQHKYHHHHHQHKDSHHHQHKDHQIHHSTHPPNKMNAANTSSLTSSTAMDAEMNSIDSSTSNDLCPKSTSFSLEELAFLGGGEPFIVHIDSTDTTSVSFLQLEIPMPY